MDDVCRITGRSKGFFELATESDACPTNVATTIKESQQRDGVIVVAKVRLATLNLRVLGISACRQRLGLIPDGGYLQRIEREDAAQPDRIICLGRFHEQIRQPDGARCQ